MKTWDELVDSYLDGEILQSDIAIEVRNEIDERPVDERESLLEEYLAIDERLQGAVRVGDDEATAQVFQQFIAWTTRLGMESVVEKIKVCMEGGWPRRELHPELTDPTARYVLQQMIGGNLCDEVEWYTNVANTVGKTREFLAYWLGLDEGLLVIYTAAGITIPWGDQAGEDTVSVLLPHLFANIPVERAALTRLPDVHLGPRSREVTRMLESIAMVSLPTTEDQEELATAFVEAMVRQVADAETASAARRRLGENWFPESDPFAYLLANMAPASFRKLLARKMVDAEAREGVSLVPRQPGDEPRVENPARKKRRSKARLFKINDLRGTVALEAGIDLWRAGQQAHTLFRDAGINYRTKGIEDLFLVAIEEGRVVGASSIGARLHEVEDDDGAMYVDVVEYTFSTVVDPSHRGLGIGRSLIEASIAECTERAREHGDASEVKFRLEVVNPDVVPVLESLGFYSDSNAGEWSPGEPFLEMPIETELSSTGVDLSARRHARQAPSVHPGRRLAVVVAPGLAGLTLGRGGRLGAGEVA